MNKLFKIVISLVVLSIAFISCQKENTTEPALEKRDFIINKDLQQLSERIHYINEPVDFQNGNKSLGYTLIASIESPLIDGQKLSATSVTGDFERAYVGFHTRGGEISGELLSLDVSNPSEPVILQSAQSDTYEINDLYLSPFDSKLWICGDAKIDGTNQAYAKEFGLDENMSHNEISNWTKLSYSFSGNSITETIMDGESHLWFTSGSKGGLEVFPSSNPQEIILGFDANNTKHFDANEEYGVVVIGTDELVTIVRIYDFNNNYNFTDYEIPYALNSLGKNGIFIEDNLVYLCMGYDGMLIMELSTGQVVEIFKNDEGMANSVFVEKDYIYVAYGNAGLFVLDKETLENLGNYKYDGSCNFVFADHDLIYLANGNGDGFLVLQEN